MKMLRKLWLVTVAMIATMALMVSTLATPVAAAEITGAVQNVNVTTTGTVNFFGGTVDFDMDWCVPDGSSAGDFFTLTLPPELKVPNSLTFDLLDSAGNVVAVATANNDVLTFTLTSFVEGRNNICGTAFLQANIDAATATPDADNDLTFLDGSNTPFEAGSVTVGPGGDDPSTRKFSFTLAEPTAAGNEITSGIQTRPLTAAEVGTTVTIVDTPGPGLEIDCSTTRVRSVQPPAPTSVRSPHPTSPRPAPRPVQPSPSW